jgi:BNR/Asp-box repeat.
MRRAIIFFVMRLKPIAFAGAIVTMANACSHTPGAQPPARQRNSLRGHLVVMQHVIHVDTVAREMMMVRHPSGALFVAGYGGVWAGSDTSLRRLHPMFWRSRMWKSVDEGATWTRVNVGPGSQGIVGNSDVALAMSPAGTLYFVTMTFDGLKGEGQGISVGVSHDAGTTWAWTVLSRNRFDDRPWAAVAPDGTAHVLWNDGSGVQHVTSTDDGATWSTPVRIYNKGGSSHLAVGPAGELAVRISPASASGNKFDPGIDMLAVSTDAGKTWRTSRAPGNRHWTPPDSAEVLPRWVEPVAWDAKGKLYSLWTDTAGVWLARSSDRGDHWTTWPIVHCTAVCYYPYLIARGDGELAATWFSNADDPLRWNAARIYVRDSGEEPRVSLSAPLVMDAWFPDRSKGQLHRDTGGEYLAPIFLQSGDIAVATVIQSPSRQGFEWWRLSDH